MYGKGAVKPGFRGFTDDLKKGQIDNVVAMHGSEPYLSKWAVGMLLGKYVNPATEALDYQVLDDDSVRCRDIIEACDTFSMFSDKRLVWVRNFGPLSSDIPKGFTAEEIDGLIEYLKNSNDRTILVFSWDDTPEDARNSRKSDNEDGDGEEGKSKMPRLKRHLLFGAQNFKFDQLSRPELISFARKRFKASGIEVTQAQLYEITDATGYFNKESEYDLYCFENDLMKIIAHSDGLNITAADIEACIVGDLDKFVFDLLDEVSANRKDQAFQILYNMLNSGLSGRPIIGAIISQLELMLELREYMDEAIDLDGIMEIMYPSLVKNRAKHMQEIKGKMFRLRKVSGYAGKYSREKIRTMLISIYEVPAMINRGLMDEQLALQLFIAGI